MARRTRNERAPRRERDPSAVTRGNLPGSCAADGLMRTLDPGVARMFKSPQGVNDALRTAAWLGIMRSFKASSTHASRTGSP